MSWFSPNTVSRYYYPEHIIFVLRNLSDIKLGLWPTRGKPDGMDTDADGKNKACIQSIGELPTVNKKGYYSAPWENVISIGVEIERRIDATGRDGRFARAIYCPRLDYDVKELPKPSYFKLAEAETKKWWYLTNTERLNKAIEIQNRVERAIWWASGNKEEDIERRTKPYKGG